MSSVNKNQMVDTALQLPNARKQVEQDNVDVAKLARGPEVSYYYPMLSISRKTAQAVAKHLRGLTVDSAQSRLRQVVTRQYAVNKKYPQAVSKVFYTLLNMQKTSYYAKHRDCSVLIINNIVVTKGPRKGVGFMPCAQGRAAPRYHDTCHIRFTVAGLLLNK